MKPSVAVGAFFASVVVGYMMSGWMCKQGCNQRRTNRVVTPGNVNVAL